MLRSLLFAILLVILLNQATADEGDGLTDGGADKASSRLRVKRQNIFQQILDLLQLLLEKQNTILSFLNTTQTTVAPSTTVSPGPYIDCTDVFNIGGVAVTGQQFIFPADGLGFLALCDMQTAGGGWTVIQSRQINAASLGTNSVFYKKWIEYESGFGIIGQSSDFWLGLEKIYRLTKQGTYELLIELESVNGAKRIAMYQPFSIGNSTTKYALSIGSYTGAPPAFLAAGDSLSYHNNHPFSTKDQDNDGEPTLNCAAQVGFGGWWYIPRYCYYADLNGAGVWHTFDVWKTLKSTKMMIRRVPSK